MSGGEGFHRANHPLAEMPVALPAGPGEFVIVESLVPAPQFRVASLHRSEIHTIQLAAVDLAQGVDARRAKGRWSRGGSSGSALERTGVSRNRGRFAG